MQVVIFWSMCQSETNSKLLSKIFANQALDVVLITSGKKEAKGWIMYKWLKWIVDWKWIVRIYKNILQFNLEGLGD